MSIGPVTRPDVTLREREDPGPSSVIATVCSTLAGAPAADRGRSGLRLLRSPQVRTFFSAMAHPQVRTVAACSGAAPRIVEDQSAVDGDGCALVNPRVLCSRNHVELRFHLSTQVRPTSPRQTHRIHVW